MVASPALAAALQATTLQALRAPNAYDALIIGAGGTGAMAAQLLTEVGLRVLVLDAGLRRSSTHSRLRRISDRIGRKLFGRMLFDRVRARRQRIQSHCYA